MGSGGEGGGGEDEAFHFRIGFPLLELFSFFCSRAAAKKAEGCFLFAFVGKPYIGGLVIGVRVGGLRDPELATSRRVGVEGQRGDRADAGRRRRAWRAG